MAIPAKIKIKRIPDYFTKCIGTYADGQFMALITATLPMPIPKQWEKHKRWYAVLHTFCPDGRHRDSVAWLAGTESDGLERVMAKARLKRDEMVTSLGSTRFCDVEIQLFSVEIDGNTFGLIDASKPAEQYECVNLLPNKFAFFPPWDGEFDT